MRQRSQILILVLLSSFFFCSIIACTPSETHTPDQIGKNHATWSRSIFFRGFGPTSGEPLTNENLKEFALTLKDAGIQYAYLFSGPYQHDGSLPDWAFSERAVSSIKSIKQYYPEIKILPWIGGIEGRTVHITDPLWARAALKSTEKLIKTLPLDGVHLDFEKLSVADPYLTTGMEPFSEESGKKYAQGVIDFHRELRRRLPNLFISSVVVSTASETRPWKRKHTLEELKELYPLVDQLSFLFYDTSIRDQVVYERSLDEQLKLIQDLKQHSPKPNQQILLAIGTFINEKELQQYRDLSIEGIPNTISVIKGGLKKINSPIPLVDGIAIYCEWQTDKEEWQQFNQAVRP